MKTISSPLNIGDAENLCPSCRVSGVKLPEDHWWPWNTAAAGVEEHGRRASLLQQSGPWYFDPGGPFLCNTRQIQGEDNEDQICWRAVSDAKTHKQSAWAFDLPDNKCLIRLCSLITKKTPMILISWLARYENRRCKITLKCHEGRHSSYPQCTIDFVFPLLIWYMSQLVQPFLMQIQNVLPTSKAARQQRCTKLPVMRKMSDGMQTHHSQSFHSYFILNSGHNFSARCI